MKILNKQQFLEQPEGTFYSEQDGDSVYFPQLHIKVETLYSNGKALDWYYINLMVWDHGDTSDFIDTYEKMINGESVQINDCGQRDGLYEEKGNFLIYEKNDLLILKKFIDEALENDK